MGRMKKLEKEMTSRLGGLEKFQKILTASLKCDKMIKILGLKGVKNMSKTVVRKNESLDDALRRFKRSVTKAGTLQEARKREHYEKPSVKRKRKSEAARKRKKF